MMVLFKAGTACIVSSKWLLVCHEREKEENSWKDLSSTNNVGNLRVEWRMCMSLKPVPVFSLPVYPMRQLRQYKTPWETTRHHEKQQDTMRNNMQDANNKTPSKVFYREDLISLMLINVCNLNCLTTFFVSCKQSTTQMTKHWSLFMSLC